VVIKAMKNPMIRARTAPSAAEASPHAVALLSPLAPEHDISPTIQTIGGVRRSHEASQIPKKKANVMRASRNRRGRLGGGAPPDVEVYDARGGKRSGSLTAHPFGLLPRSSPAVAIPGRGRRPIRR
jgi:hypothetical protein